MTLHDRLDAEAYRLGRMLDAIERWNASDRKRRRPHTPQEITAARAKIRRLGRKIAEAEGHARSDEDDPVHAKLSTMINGRHACHLYPRM